VLVGEIGAAQQHPGNDDRPCALTQGGREYGAVISSVKMYPDFDEILKELKGEDEHEKPTCSTD
jgi:hypothetical protein